MFGNLYSGMLKFNLLSSIKINLVTFKFNIKNTFKLFNFK